MKWWNIKYYTMYPFTETKIVLGITEDVVIKRFMRENDCSRDKIVSVVSIGSAETITV